MVLLVELAKRRRVQPIEHVRLVLISGARWIKERTPELRALFPRARIVEFYGTSETSFVSWQECSEAAPQGQVGRAFPGVEIRVRPKESHSHIGTIFVKSRMLFAGYENEASDRTAARWDGEWLTVGDIGFQDADGQLHLIGRESRMIVTCGKNLFAEEVETVLETVPGIDAASVHAVADGMRGASVIAILQRSESEGNALSARGIATACAERLDSFKIPRTFYIARSWPRTPSGKTDHKTLSTWVRQLATTAEPGSVACLSKLH
jgi:long-chain acyl-CoA synthetase